MPHATEVHEEKSATIPHLEYNNFDAQHHLSSHAIDISKNTNIKPKDVPARLHYLSPSVVHSKTEPPIQVVTRSSTTRDSRTTVKISEGPIENIHDVRGREHEFTLEKNGFQFVRNDFEFTDWESKDGIWSKYIEELKDVVARAFGGESGGVNEIIAFHEGKRGSNKEWRQSSDGQRTNPFARQVHVDQSEPTIQRIVNEKTDIKGQWLWKGRVRQVNAWKPLYHPVYDCGLCVADAATVRADDLIEAHRIREADGGFLDTMGVVSYREGRDWYYKSQQEPEDVVLFMGYDSDCKRGKREGTGFTLHSAFDIPDPPIGSPPRASIEVRLLVFTWPEEPLVISRPLAGMLTTKVPPRSEESYQSHHTENLEMDHHIHRVISLPDETGETVEIDLNDYDPLETDDVAAGALYSPASSPSPQRRLSTLTRSSSACLSEEVTDAQIVELADNRVQDIRAQLELLTVQLKSAEKLKSMVQSSSYRRTLITAINERRYDERGRQRLQLARKIRGSFSGDLFFDL